VAKVGEGDRIRTGADSRALLVLCPDATAELESDSVAVLRRLSLAEDGLWDVELEIQRGDTWHELTASTEAETRYEISTPSAIVTLSTGRLQVTVSDDGSTQVEVSQGMAKVRALNTEVEVWSGEHTSVAPGRAPALPRPTVARILFVNGRDGNADIWVLDEEGQEAQLTSDPADDLAPAWSPEGTRVAFESMRDGDSEIYVMNADGSDQANLTDNSVPDHSPAWSPDGKRIAFESLRDGTRDIYVMNADGSEVMRLTFGVGLSLAPHWSADSEQIIFTRIEGDSNGDGSIDHRDMGAPFRTDETGKVQSFWGGRMVYDQLIFPWARRRVG
jgi:WD40 repeat protein